jgi:hypothetical protein
MLASTTMVRDRAIFRQLRQTTRSAQHPIRFSPTCFIPGVDELVFEITDFRFPSSRCLRTPLSAIYIGARPVAALVYQRDKHIIDLFAWPASEAKPATEFTHHNGYNVLH